MTATHKPSPAELMAKPALDWSEFWGDLLGLPDSTAEQIAREPSAPKFFMLGRRRFILTSEARIWLEQRAAATPYVPRRNKRSKSGVEQ